jgi:hypothetical protein
MANITRNNTDYQSALSSYRCCLSELAVTNNIPDLQNNMYRIWALERSYLPISKSNSLSEQEARIIMDSIKCDCCG